LNPKLIICTEGNAGFYEAGIMSSAIETHHSVLGWNHPGFGYSTVNNKCLYQKIISLLLIILYLLTGCTIYRTIAKCS